jgi:hypothetical protein
MANREGSTARRMHRSQLVRNSLRATKAVGKRMPELADANAMSHLIERVNSHLGPRRAPAAGTARRFLLLYHPDQDWRNAGAIWGRFKAISDLR